MVKIIRAYRDYRNKGCWSVQCKRAHDRNAYWVDVWQNEDGELSADWNQYIFHTDDSDDIGRKAFQDNQENADEFFGAAMDYIEDKEAKGLVNSFRDISYDEWCKHSTLC